MPYPIINTNSSNNKCCKMAPSPASSLPQRGAGVGRVMFLGNPRSTLVNRYVAGSGVGVINTSNRRALLRRAVQNDMCCTNSNNSLSKKSSDGAFNITLHFNNGNPKTYEIKSNIISSSILDSLNIPKLSSICIGFFSNSINIIEANTFKKYKNLIFVDIPNVTGIDSNAFWQCNSLKTLTAPALQNIELAAFTKCNSLTDLKIPVLQSIGNTAFSNCTSLTKLSAPSLQFIGEEVFIDSGLTILDAPILITLKSKSLLLAVNLTTLNTPRLNHIENNSLITCSKLNSIKMYNTCIIVITKENPSPLQIIKSGNSGTITLTSTYNTYKEARASNSKDINNLVGKTLEGDKIKNATIKDLLGWTLKYEKISI